MKQEQPVFQIGDSVVVKDGAKDPDNEIVDIGGWQGRITEIDQAEGQTPVFLVEWDGPTLRELPESFIAENLLEGLDYTSMYLGPEDISPAEHRDTLEETESAQVEVTGRFIGQLVPPAAQEAIVEYTQIREELRAVYNEAMGTVTREEVVRAAKQLGLLRGRDVLACDSEEELSVLMDFTLYELRREGIPIIQWYLLRNNPALQIERNLDPTIASAIGALFHQEEVPPVDVAKLNDAVSRSFTSLFQVDDLAPGG